MLQLGYVVRSCTLLKTYATALQTVSLVYETAKIFMNAMIFAVKHGLTCVLLHRLRQFGMRTIIQTTFIALTMSGCATNPDPSEGGFINGIVGLAGGGYQRRIEANERVYRDEVQQQERLSREAQTLEQERAAVRSELNQATDRLRALEQRIQQQRTRIAAQRAANRRQQEQQLARAQTKLSQAKTSLGSIKVENADDRSLETTKAQVRLLESQLAEIDELATISRAGL